MSRALETVPKLVSPFLKETHLRSIDQFSREDLRVLFDRAALFEKQGGPLDRTRYEGKVLGTFFGEPSTRTRLSFESAMLRLGGQVLPIPDRSALAEGKGEDRADSLRIISTYVDLLVFRSGNPELFTTACELSEAPVINAGDGANEHPTQALLDLYTIEKEKGTIDGLTITIVGDLKSARVTHSLVRGLAKFDVDIVFVSPRDLTLPEAYLRDIPDCRARFHEESDLPNAVAKSDVLYVVMLHDYRITDENLVAEMTKVYPRVTPELIQHGKPEMIVLHPLHRRFELSRRVDALPQARYFQQAKNGLWIRMALLSLLLDCRSDVNESDPGRHH